MDGAMTRAPPGRKSAGTDHRLCQKLDPTQSLDRQVWGLMGLPVAEANCPDMNLVKTQWVTLW